MRGQCREVRIKLNKHTRRMTKKCHTFWPRPRPQCATFHPRRAGRKKRALMGHHSPRLVDEKRFILTQVKTSSWCKTQRRNIASRLSHSGRGRVSETTWEERWFTTSDWGNADELPVKNEALERSSIRSLSILITFNSYLHEFTLI